MDTKIAVKDSMLKAFFVNRLQDIYRAGKKQAIPPPKLREAAAAQQLRDVFGARHIETEKHIERIERVFQLIGEDRHTIRCAAMAGLVDEADQIIDETEEATAQRDVGLIFPGQKAEHYEIVTHQGLRSLGITLGYNDVAELLHQTLEEEKDADSKLSSIAKNHVHYQAAGKHQQDSGS